MDTYYDQNNFFLEVIHKQYFNLEKEFNIVYDTTQKGSGRGKDSLIPAFCDLFNIIYTGTNPYVNSLTSNKYDWTKLLDYSNIQVPKTIKITQNSNFLDFSKELFLDKLTITKPNFTYASIGISKSSLNSSRDKAIEQAMKINNTLHQPAIIQEFIAGYEIEIGIIGSINGPIILPIVGISIEEKKLLKNSFLDFEKVSIDDYTFYLFEEIAPKKIISQIIKACNKLSSIIDFEGHLRIDMRVDTKFDKFYIFDINVYPHIVEHSSFNFAFKSLGFETTELLPALIGNAIQNYHQYTSDQI
ncbi:ATP-grasp domain-containing protein [Enterococcus plantarum]|uniref:ATP-grasp domain-containing protein n=1 Tax=Enterococcus plantarum TaxID=1077675 RepID=UPI0015E8EAE9|nr:ATP-grasp domain-containing protein [Enterococcus plantarum]